MVHASFLVIITLFYCFSFVLSLKHAPSHITLHQPITSNILSSLESSFTLSSPKNNPQEDLADLSFEELRLAIEKKNQQANYLHDSITSFLQINASILDPINLLLDPIKTLTSALDFIIKQINSFLQSDFTESTSCIQSPFVLRETALCIRLLIERILQKIQLAKTILMANVRILSGGRKALKACLVLKGVALESGAMPLMKLFGIEYIVKHMMKKGTVPDILKWRLGSILVRLKDYPVVSNIAEKVSGSYGHVNVIVPSPRRLFRGDRMKMFLDAGVDPLNLAIGPYTGLEGLMPF